MLNKNSFISSENQELKITHLYTVDGYFTFNIKVRSGEFAGASNFCMPKEHIICIVETFSQMLKSLEGSCIVKDYDSDAHVVFEIGKLGHICILGQIGGSHEDQSMKFKYTTDQTVLANILQMFKALL
ncbi:hypothetical protein ACE41H_17365 [Paenibacillus enshidis]|uniref:Uncharacterized protein n=1 Tax=Paenibacillus enshidis TaxID=1458439 RepID=A0ABV5AWE7_9BACL